MPAQRGLARERPSFSSPPFRRSLGHREEPAAVFVAATGGSEADAVDGHALLKARGPPQAAPDEPGLVLDGGEARRNLASPDDDARLLLHETSGLRVISFEALVWG